jgi:hypothetical protein
MKNFLNLILTYIFTLNSVVSFIGCFLTIALDGLTSEVIAWFSSGIMGLVAQYF